jgi:hypothetical protein
MLENQNETNSTQTITAVSLKRNELGLIDGVDYKFVSPIEVDWRKMIKHHYLVPNVKVTKETNVAKLQDDELLILLAGLKELAFLRGYTNVEFRPCSAYPEYFATVCRINWVGNFETGGQPITFESIGDAHSRNTSGFGSDFLAAIAENRAFARCVRNFLRIHITSKEEMDAATLQPSKGITESNNVDMFGTLAKLMKKKNFSFEKIKESLADEGMNVESLHSVTDIPRPKVFELIERLKKVKN